MSEYTITVACGGETQTATFTPGAGPALAVAVDTTADPVVTVTVTGPATLAEVSVDFGDQSTPATVALTAGTGSVQHTYATNGTFTVTGSAPGHTSGSAQAVIAAAPAGRRKG